LRIKGTVALGTLLLACEAFGGAAFPPLRAPGPASKARIAAAPTLSGAYVLALAGRDANGFLVILASFQADGAGTISSGVCDRGTSVGVAQNLGFSGTYTLDADGRGKLSFQDSAGNTGNLAFVLENDRAQVISFDASANTRGTIERQDPSAFSPSVLQGGFGFHLDGVDANGYTTSWVGRFNLSTTGTVTSGLADFNEGGTTPGVVQTFTGSYAAPGPGGRGTLTMAFAAGTLDFVYYVVSASKIVLLERDFLYFLTGGAAERQQAGPFSAASLAGNYAFATAGYNAVGLTIDVGQFKMDGAGNIVGLVDENGRQLLAPVIEQALSGSYTVTDSTAGRGTISLSLPFGTATYIFYTLGPGKAFLIEYDTFRVTSGDFRVQSGGPFPASTFAGAWGLQFSGATSGGLTDQTVQIGADGQLTLVGTNDQNAPPQDPSSLALGAGSSYMVDANGHGSLTFITSSGTSSLLFYFVSPTQVLIIGTLDGSQVVNGEGNKQPPGPLATSLRRP